MQQGQVPVCDPAGHPLVMAQAGDTWLGEAPWERCWWVGQEAAMCPGSKGGHLPPGLDGQECGQEIKRGHCPGYCVRISDPQDKNDVGKLEGVW